MGEGDQLAPNLGAPSEDPRETRCGGQLVTVPAECELQRLGKLLRRMPPTELRIEVRLPPLGDPGPPPPKACDNRLADGSGSRTIQRHAKQLKPFGVIRPRFDPTQAVKSGLPTDRPQRETPLQTRRRLAAAADPSSQAPPRIRPVSLQVSAPRRLCASAIGAMQE